MERMGSLDAVFVAAEDAVNHLHIGSVGIFAGPPPSHDEVRALVASKLQLVPRYRQRVREAPFSIGRPMWVDDVHFDLDYHLRATALPPHADGDPLEVLVARVMSQPLDRRRPLWEMWVIDGLTDDRWAVLSKVHHCMVDGIAGSDLLGVVMDAAPDAAPPACRRVDAGAGAVTLRPRSGVGSDGVGVGGWRRDRGRRCGAASGSRLGSRPRHRGRPRTRRSRRRTERASR